MREKFRNSLAVAVYGSVLPLPGVAYYILAQVLIRLHGQDSTLATSIGSDIKGKISIAIYAVGIGLAFLEPRLANACYVVVAFIGLFPDRRIEKKLEHGGDRPIRNQQNDGNDDIAGIGK